MKKFEIIFIDLPENQFILANDMVDAVGKGFDMKEKIDFNVNVVNDEPCLHEGNITYLDLIQIDGCPQYIVRCEDCGKKGIIYLSESYEDWNTMEQEVENLIKDNKLGC